MFGEVPVLPVVVPLAAASFAALLGSLHRRDRLSLPRAAVALVLCVYAAGVAANTIFPIFLDPPATDSSWSHGVHLLVLRDYEAADALTNVLVFLPLGLLVPLLLRSGSPWRALGVAAALSLGIEAVQYVTANTLAGGHIADVNDFLFNVVGAAVGILVFSGLSRVPRLVPVIDRFRWR